MKEYFETESCTKYYKSRVNATYFMYILFITILIFVTKETGFVLLLPLLLFFLYLQVGYPYRIKERIIISENFIEYYGVNYSFQVDWDKIKKINIRKELTGTQEGLIIEYRSVKYLTLKTGGIPRYIPREFFIPLSCFSNNWRDTKLGQQIKQHAPHLFE